MHIVFLEENTVVLDGDIDLDGLRALGLYRGLSLDPRADPVPHCGDAEVLVVNKMKMTAGRIQALPGLRLICVAATGYDNVDLEAAGSRGVRVANVQGYAGRSVAQHLFAMILGFATQVPGYARDVRRGDWGSSDTFHLLRYPSFELAGRVIGIVGFGAIGRNVARIAEGFGMRVLVHDVADLSVTGYRSCALEELLAESDIVTLHCPLTDRTRDLIDARALKNMKPTALLFNTARGGIVNEADLARALREGVIAGAGVDTLTAEPPAGGNPLLEGVPNLVVTPHVAWTSRDARQRLMDGVVENIKRFREGRFEGFVA